MPKAAIQFNTLLANGVIEPVAGAQVTINAAGTGDTVALFEDRDGNVGQNNPFFADADGQFLVYADGGRVDIIVDDGDGNVATAFDVQLVTGVEIDGDQWDFDQMLEVDGIPIVESGSNSDGEFARYADGTQITTRSVPHDANDTSPQVWEYPKLFESRPRGSYSVESGPGAAGDATAWYQGEGVVHARDTETWRTRTAAASEDRILTIDLFAFGRWF